MLGDKEIEERFVSHSAISDEDVREQIIGHSAICDGFIELAKMLDRLLPDGRQKALALTGLEDSAMWANKAHASRYPAAGRLI